MSGTRPATASAPWEADDCGVAELFWGNKLYPTLSVIHLALSVNGSIRAHNVLDVATSSLAQVPKNNELSICYSFFFSLIYPFSVPPTKSLCPLA